MKSGRKTRYKNLPFTIVTFITQEDIFKRDLTKYTFTERCEEISDLLLEDGTTKIFLNMTSKNGDPVLVSLLQYMKKTQLNNPEVLVWDDRIRKLDKIVAEVKQSEEWEAVKMSILSIGLERGKEQGIEQGIKAVIKMCIEFKLTRAGAKERLISEFSITDEDAEAALSKFWQD